MALRPRFRQLVYSFGLMGFMAASDVYAVVSHASIAADDSGFQTAKCKEALSTGLTPSERKAARETVFKLRQHLNSEIIGQAALIDKVLYALLTGKHLLIEGPKGTAKTRLVKAVAEALEGEFSRIQFTPDLLPSDITGSEIFNAANQQKTVHFGPIFANVVLADEINRASPRTQSGLLEAMAEKQVSIGGKSYGLPELYLLIATQNPNDSEGTYLLPEAQMDRFAVKFDLDYSVDTDDERSILELMLKEAREAFASDNDDSRENRSQTAVPPVATIKDILQARVAVSELKLHRDAENFLLNIITLSRDRTVRLSSTKLRDLKEGISPRGTLALTQNAAVEAWIQGREEITVEDIKTVAPFTIAHRLKLTPESRVNPTPATELTQGIVQELLILAEAKISNSQPKR